MVVALLVFPVVVGISGVVAAAVLGSWLDAEGRASHPDSELIETNY